MGKIIYLDYYRAHPVDRNAFFNNHDGSDQTYKMLKGAPLLICVEGSYVEVRDLPNLVVNKCQGFIVNQWVANVLKSVEPAFITYKWRR